MPRRLRLSAVLLGILFFPGLLCAQEDQFFQAPAGGKVRFTFRWDALARYDHIDHLRVRPDIDRGRFEVRPEVAVEFSDRFKIGVRAVADLGTDSNENNVPFFDNYRSRGATLERYYLEGRPGGWTIRAGSFGMPLVSTEMLWDRDIQTAGVAVAREVAAGGSTITFAAAGFLGPQREGDRTRIGAGQAVWRMGDPDRLSLEAALSYWHFDPERLKTGYLRQNYTVVAAGVRGFLSRFRIVDALVRLRFPLGKLPATVSLDGALNTGVQGIAADDDTAFEGSVSVGRVGNPGEWRAFYTYQYVERDAVLGAYNTDDWWFHSWYRGHRTGVAVTILPRVFVQGTLMIQNRLDLSGHLNRVTLDLVKMF